MFYGSNMRKYMGDNVVTFYNKSYNSFVLKCTIKYNVQLINKNVNTYMHLLL